MTLFLAILLTIIFALLVMLLLRMKSSEKMSFAFISTVIILLTVVIKIEKKIVTDLNIGKPASLSILDNGEKYELVATYEKYIIVKSSANNNEKLKFIGPLDFGTGTATTGRYIKTAKSLEKLE